MKFFENSLDQLYRPGGSSVPRGNFCDFLLLSVDDVIIYLEFHYTALVVVVHS